MKRLIFLTLVGMLVTMQLFAKSYTLVSPDKAIAVEVNVADDITYSVSRNGNVALRDCHIAMETSRGVFGHAPKVMSVKKTEHDGVYRPYNHYKAKEVRDAYSEMAITFKDGWSLEFRAYDNGAAYRIVSSAKGRMTVKSEVCELGVPDEAELCLSLVDEFRTMYEQKYTFEKAADVDTVAKMSYLPIMATTKDWVMLVTETDLYDYPAAFFKSGEDGRLVSVFPEVVTKTAPKNTRRELIIETAGYIAETDCARTFPWRVINLVDSEADLLHSHLTGQLARERDMNQDWSWIKPGKVSWDWWSRFNLQGVDFEYGINNDTYKHYIDFASEYGIPYIILDEGWTKDSYTPFEFREGIDIHELVSYGKERGVGLILWVSWLAVDKNFSTVFETYRDWGVAGMKIDFMYKNIAMTALYLEFHYF